jgi:hypothetical protein
MKRIIILLPLLLSTGTLHAGSGNRTGTNGASELLIPFGTRDIAMAGATTATTSGADALFSNPAGTARIGTSVGLFASHMNYIADIGVDCGAVSANFDQFGVLSLYIKTLSFGDIPVTTVLTPDGTGETFRPQFFTIGLNYARQLTDRISVGAAAMLITEHMGEVSASGVAFSAGVIYDGLASVKGLSIGVAVKNIGPQMTFDGPGLTIEATPPQLGRPSYFYNVDAASFELPSAIDLGIGYRSPVSEDNVILVAASFQNNNFSDDEYKFGLEYAFEDLLFLRGGYDLQPSDSDLRENIFGASFGAGVHAIVGTVDVTFDYAYRSAKFFGGEHVFSVKLGL